MSYQVLIQPPAFEEIETAYRWMCDYLSADAANQWYYDLQDAIASLQQFPYRCSVAPEAAIIDREIRQVYMQSSNVVILDPDVAEIFRDSASVNEALRLLAKIAKSVTV